MAKQMAFYFDASACTNCKACEIACQDKNELPPAIRWRRVFEYRGGGWVPDVSVPNLYRPNNIFAYAVSVACMHCEQPICVDICPAAAITKRDDGVVLIDQNKCVGCRYCQWACPYGAPAFDESRGVMTKCTFCEDLQAQGQNPACVDACPMRALDFGELSELRAKYGDVNAIAPLPTADITQPSMVISPPKHAQRVGSDVGTLAILPEEV
jgi:anaerobic dimethyl sulfoxide reductase subunit B (iron-sulfur subunit)